MRIVINYKSDQDKYVKKLKSLNGLLNLTEAEIEILSWFLYYRDKYSDGKEEVVFHSFIRKKIMIETAQTSHNITMKIRGLKTKGVILAQGADLVLSSRIIKMVSQDSIELAWIFKEE